MIDAATGDRGPQLILTGFMGAGKSTIGRAAAKRLGTPFIDTDAIGETQTMTNNADDPLVPAIPRYPAGKVIAVAQSAASTVGTFTFTYTNQAGVGGRVSQAHRTFAVAGGGQVVSADGGGTSFNPYLALQSGDTGVKSIESVTFTGAGGGLMALVIVKPLFNGYVTQECRTTTGVAYGAADEFMSIINAAGAPQIDSVE